MILSRHDDNGKLIQRHLDDENLRSQLNQFRRRQAYQMSRRRKGIA